MASTPEEIQRQYVIQITYAIDLLHALRRATMAGNFSNWSGELLVFENKLLTVLGAAHCANQYLANVAPCPNTVF